ncbi:AAA family ATPase [Nitrosopumilus sp.]|uniref:ATP-dependent nuclease n=1 Tax=Nitrosopumilus sp. TaxID=2024843 RepID=UPI00247D06A1|nr:AAA family ATPase [Nitrosopumilus sp.]MCV0410757.1 AAA family ATPase [Nitrosopumilus sp.]
MKLKSFEIKNFRSIKHLKCQLSPKITVLAGKNESGKTSILLALSRIRTRFNDDDIPHFAEKGDVSITCTFELSNSEVSIAAEKFEIHYAITSYEIKVKTTPSKDYEFSGELYEKLKNAIIEESKDARSSFNAIIHEMKELGSGDLPVKKIDNFEMEVINQNTTQLSNMQTQIQQNPGVYGPKITSPQIASALELLPKLAHPAKELSILEEIFENLIPNTIYFNSFEDRLPAEIDLTDAINECNDENKLSIVRDFVTLSELDLEELKNPDRQHRAKVTNKATKISSDIFGKFWDQDPIEIEISYDEPKLTFFVRDQGKEFPFKPSQRSKGIQWFMCFLARLFSEGVPTQDNLILIDEPGLYLHSTAQQNVLNRLEDLSDENNQIIFSTHSPYLIDPSKLNRVRLVNKNSDKITTLENQFNKDADIETIAPIIASIGLDLSQGIGFSKKKNIIVEGVSDYYYLIGIKKLIEKILSEYKFPDDIALIPCVGESKVSLLASFFIGYNLDYKILLDEKGTKQTRKKLENDGLKEKIIIVGDNGQSIEDMFEKSDFEKFCTSKNNTLSKTLLSKQFLEKIETGEITSLQETTINNFLAIFEQLKSN